MGLLTAATLLAELPELGQGEGKPLAALVGVAPITRQSGTQRTTAQIQAGRTPVRNALYLAALSAVRHNPVLHAHYTRLRARGRAAKVALVACAHHLLLILHAILRDGTMWQAPEVTIA